LDLATVIAVGAKGLVRKYSLGGEAPAVSVNRSLSRSFYWEMSPTSPSPKPSKLLYKTRPGSPSNLRCQFVWQLAVTPTKAGATKAPKGKHQEAENSAPRLNDDLAERGLNAR